MTAILLTSFVALILGLISMPNVKPQDEPQDEEYILIKRTLKK